MELFKLDMGLIFWMIVAVCVLLFVLGKWAWPVIVATVDERANLIDRGVEYAESAQKQLENARADADKLLAEGRRQQSEILREADKMKAQIIEEARTAAQKEAQKVMDSAKLSIEQARKEAEKSFRDEVSSFAIDIAQKVVKQQLNNDKAQAELVDKLLNDLAANN